MIAVVADDLTGAAELAAAGLSFGLKPRIVREPPRESGAADLLVLDTDSRSLSATDAALRVSAFAESLKRLRPEAVYKKTDSVLCGHVQAENGVPVCGMPDRLFEGGDDVSEWADAVADALKKTRGPAVVAICQDVAVLRFAASEFGLKESLRLSVHSGSDKFSIYPAMNRAIKESAAGLHLKTAGTT